MTAAYVIPAGLTVPIATFTGLWFWCLRPSRRASLKPGTPPTQARLAEMATGICARQERLQEQIAALGHAWEERDRRLAAQVGNLIETAAKAAKVDLDSVQRSIERGSHR